jgi:hypothetical protein
MASSIAAIAAACWALAGCTQDLCSRNTDCPTGKVCSELGTCIIPPPPSDDGGTDGTASAVDAATDAAIDAAIDATAAVTASSPATAPGEAVCPAVTLPCWPALTRAAIGASAP